MMDMNVFTMSFDNLVGMDINNAEKGLRTLLPHFKIERVIMGSAVTQDLNPRRIRVYYDPKTMKVVYTPRNG